MQTAAIHSAIAPIIEPSLEAMGYDLVRIIWQGSNKRRILQIMAERQDGVDMTVEDCAEISHVVSALLDVKDPIDGAYELEVSSPGVDRPLMCKEDFEEYQGHEVKVEMAIPLEGRKRFKGVIDAITDEAVDVVDGGDRFALLLEDMASAKLVMTDKLMKEMMQRRQGSGIAAEIVNN